jgi:phage tail sheath protein FI
VPDAVNLPADDPASATPWASDAFRSVVRAMLQQCGTLQDRFAILDVYGTQHATADNWQAIIEQFRADVGDESLGYGAAYFPFLTGAAQSSANAQLPSSAALAGVYTAVDRNKGVWNAPANVSVAGVSGLSFPLTNAQQEFLNVPVDGRAVDAIREFDGRGRVVWGSRTLDGNSNDNRYIQVRRTLIYIEQSIKLALQQFVFAANNGRTWTIVISAVSSFLQGLWNEGGLFGATASEAFSVECGLGSTMTQQDILDGYMVVQVTVQMIRPAEFIELTFRQKLEGG